MSTTETHSGGCQCGAIRYRIDGPLRPAGFCHCRMCQKAFGNFGAALTGVGLDALHWTRGQPATFRSSPVVARGFCRDCGTPLFMLEDGWPIIEIAVGTLDDPSASPPDHVVGVESKLSWADGLADLPGRRTDQDRNAQDIMKLRSLQHPDHDTTSWPPENRD